MILRPIAELLITRMTLLASARSAPAANDPADFLPGNDNKEEQDRRTRRAFTHCVPRCMRVRYPTVTYCVPPSSLARSLDLLREHVRMDPFTAKPDGAGGLAVSRVA